MYPKVCYSARNKPLRGEDMNVDALIEKYQDVLDCAESWEEKNLISEFLDDLKDIKRV